MLSLTLAAVSLRIKALEDQLGQRFLVRSKAVRTTAAGQALLARVKQVRLMETDVVGGLTGGAGVRGARWQSPSVAINADLAASWFLPGVAPVLLRHQLLPEIVIYDQDHTHDLLKSGDAMGCATNIAHAMRGCVAEPLGAIRYHCAATAALAQRCRMPGGAVLLHRLLAQPAIILKSHPYAEDQTRLARRLGQRVGRGVSRRRRQGGV